jgi:hypothetical protein
MSEREKLRTYFVFPTETRKAWQDAVKNARHVDTLVAYAQCININFKLFEESMPHESGHIELEPFLDKIFEKYILFHGATEQTSNKMYLTLVRGLTLYIRNLNLGLPVDKPECSGESPNRDRYLHRDQRGRPTSAVRTQNKGQLYESTAMRGHAHDDSFIYEAFHKSEAIIKKLGPLPDRYEKAAWERMERKFDVMTTSTSKSNDLQYNSNMNDPGPNVVIPNQLNALLRERTQRTLGEGAYGIANLTTWHAFPFVRKTFKSDNSFADAIREQYAHITIFSRLLVHLQKEQMYISIPIIGPKGVSLQTFTSKSKPVFSIPYWPDDPDEKLVYGHTRRKLGDNLAFCLASLHSYARAVHNDLSPANMMITPNGLVLIDFGSAVVSPNAKGPPIDLLWLCDSHYIPRSARVDYYWTIPIEQLHSDKVISHRDWLPRYTKEIELLRDVLCWDAGNRKKYFEYLNTMQNDEFRGGFP